MGVQKVGVIGAGVMGIGVAQSLAQTGHQAILIDLSEDILARARQEIRNHIRLQGFNKQKRADPDEILSRIAFTTDYTALADTELVVENVVERWDVKAGVYARLDAVCPGECVFAANTSAISITRLGSATARADKVIGMHFMNPVPLKMTVEVVRGYHTSEHTLDIAKAFLAQLGKDCIVVNDAPGFVANRLSHVFMNEAANLVLEQVAEPKDIDEIFKKCYGHAMGPLETADLIGLDTVVDTLQILYESFQDPKFRCSPLLRKLVDAGRYGRKSGQGFYLYRRTGGAPSGS